MTLGIHVLDSIVFCPFGINNIKKMMRKETIIENFS